MIKIYAWKAEYLGEIGFTVNESVAWAKAEEMKEAGRAGMITVRGEPVVSWGMSLHERIRAARSLRR